MRRKLHSIINTNVHDSECCYGAGENGEAGVPHCHDCRDEERLVAQLGDDYHTVARNKSKYEDWVANYDINVKMAINMQMKDSA